MNPSDDPWPLSFTSLKSVKVIPTWLSSIADKKGKNNEHRTGTIKSISILYWGVFNIGAILTVGAVERDVDVDGKKGDHGN